MKFNKDPAVYILSNRRNTVLYTGVTSNLKKRVWKHKNKIVKGFTLKYNIDKLVFYELHDTMESAIEKEKNIKGGSRKKKENLINDINPEWKDLYDKL